MKKLAAAGLACLVAAPVALAAPRPGSQWKGRTAQKQAIGFQITSDGQGIFRIAFGAKVPCPGQGNKTKAEPHGYSGVVRKGSRLKGSGRSGYVRFTYEFTSDTRAKGTVRVRYPIKRNGTRRWCDSGTVRWTASRAR